MKFKFKVLAALLAVLLIFNCVPVGFASNEIQLYIKDDADIRDYVTDMEYGWDGKTYSFGDGLLVTDEGEPVDNVYLAAKTKVTGALKAGETVQVVLYGFTLEGSAAERYILPRELNDTTVEKTIQITKKTLVVQLQGTSVYYGQPLPENNTLTELADYSAQIVKGDTVNVSCAFAIENCTGEVGSYALTQSGEIVLSGEGAENYQVMIGNEAPLAFEIKAYTPDVEADDGGNEGVYIGVDEAKLTAPKGFEIRLPDGKWGSDVQIELTEEKGEVAYELRNAQKDSEEYLAVARKTYSYTKLVAPTVTGLEIKPINDGTTVEYRDDGVYADDDLQVTVLVATGMSAQEVTVSLGDLTQKLDADAAKQNEAGVYIYEAVFELEAEADACKSFKLNARAETAAGEHTYQPGENDAFGEKVYIDKTKPVVTGLKIEAVNEDAIVKYRNDGVFSGCDLKVTVYVEGGTIAQNMTISLGDLNMGVNADAAVWNEQGKCTYQATFDLTAEDGQSLGYSLTAKAKSHAGEGTYQPGRNDTFVDSDEKVRDKAYVDKRKPEVTEIRIDEVKASRFGYTYTKKLVATVTVEDIHSGIVKLEYKWDDGDYHELQYSDKQSTYQIEYTGLGGVVYGTHTLYLRITDAVGNVYEGDGAKSEPIDGVPPVIDSVLVEGAEDTSYGLLANNAVRVVIRAHDDDGGEGSAVTGVQSVVVTGTLLIETGDKKEPYKEEDYEGSADLDEELGAYVLTIQPDVRLTNIQIKAMDSNGGVSKNLKDIPIYQAPPAEGETAAAEPRYYKSNTIYVENNKPEKIVWNVLAEEGFANQSDGVLWLGSDDIEKDIVFTVDDGIVSAGLKSVVVNEVITAADGTTTVSRLGFEDGIYGEKVISVSVNVSLFTEGNHTIQVVAIDHCGNKSEPAVFMFRKDTKSTESGKIELSTFDKDTDNVAVLGDEEWFTPVIDTENDLNGCLSFKIGTTADNEELEKIIVTINGEHKTEISRHDQKRWKTNENGSNYVIIEAVKKSERIEPLPPNENIKYNHYIVKAVFVDKAGNDPQEETRIIYVDNSVPVIEKITVQKADPTLLDEIVRILSFGIFSNDDLIFRVYTYDAFGDCGIANVEMAGTEKKHYPVVSKETDELERELWVYSFEIAESDLTKLGVNLSFVATDRLGKSVEKFLLAGYPSENGADKELDEVFVMIESVVPTLMVEFPKADGFERKDDQIWFNDNREMKVVVQDVDSGLYSVRFYVNGISVEDGYVKNEDGTLENQKLIAQPGTERNKNGYEYFFYTDKLVEKAGISANGAYELKILVEDNSGNVHPWEETFYVDKAAPDLNKISFSTATTDGIQETTNFDEELKYNFFFKQNFTVTAHVSDASVSSGLHHVEYWYQSPEGAGLSADIVDGKAEIAVSENFKGRIYYRVWDYAGNFSEIKTTAGFVVDQTAPTITIQKNVSANYTDAAGNPLYIERANAPANSFTVTITDTVSGLRTFGYSKTSEREESTRKEITLNADAKYELNQNLGDGWIVTGKDANLVTQVTKQYNFDTDDNDIQLTFNAKDRSMNAAAEVKSEKFTVDKTAPTVLVDFGDDNDDDQYYSQNRTAVITVTERNFDAGLMNVIIRNTFGDVPGYSFTTVSKTVHTATIVFDEGDYTFSMNGKDMGGHAAIVTFTGGNENEFYVDKTVPVVRENFHEFANDAENSFNMDKTASITIVEHNFDSSLTNLRITRKAAGTEHSHDGMVDVTKEVLNGRGWVRNGDSYTISFTFSEDAVYYVVIEPVDLASNRGEKHNTVIFEIDKTIPVVSAKNGEAVDPEATEFLDVYNYMREDSPTPTVAFTDHNIAYIEYVLTAYIPAYLSDGLVRVEPVIERGKVEGSLFTLENFNQDGIYALELTAVDVAGNRSVVNFNTYARMVNQDVLAFILDSKITEKTGLFSLEHEDGNAISKKPYDFKNLRILVMTPAETNIDIVLRDTNGNEILTDASLTSLESVYGVNVYTFELAAQFFQEHFEDDIDTEMHLTVRNQGYRIDLARIHIDNIAPDGDFPEELFSWAWFVGNEDRTFTISNISELLEVDDCKVYDNGEAIPFEYSVEEDTVTFTLSEGWHNVGFILCDAAGNANISSEMSNIHIGHFWSNVIVGSCGAAIVGLIVALIRRRRRVEREMDEDA